MDSHQLPLASTVGIAALLGASLMQQWLLMIVILTLVLALAFILRATWRRNQRLSDR
jgi:flagellar biogenesis protein FliO